MNGRLNVPTTSDHAHNINVLCKITETTPANRDQIPSSNLGFED